PGGGPARAFMRRTGRRAAKPLAEPSAVVPDRLDRALLLGLEAQLDLLVRGRLRVHEVVVPVRRLLEVRRRDVRAEVAQDALLVDVEGAGHVVGVLVSLGGHGAGLEAMGAARGAICGAVASGSL